MDEISEKNVILKTNNKKKIPWKHKLNKTDLICMSIVGWENNNLTMFKLPFCAAAYNGVLFKKISLKRCL